MAEEENEELEGFDDLDGLLDEDAGGGGDDSFAGELDDFLGADDAGGEEAGAGEEGGGADSELDSFFEDLSTIDDLEVAQEEAPADVAPEEAPAAEAAPEAAPAAEAAPETAAVAVAAAVAAPVAAAAPKVRKERPWLKRAVMYLVLLGLLGGSGYYAYTTLFPSIEVPWPVVEQILEEDQPVQVAMQPPPRPLPFTPPPPPPLAPIAAAPPPPSATPAPAPAAGPPPAKGKAYGVQVATCFFSSCVKGFQSLLARNNRAHITTEKTTRSESLEIMSTTVFAARQTADETAQRINSEHRLEGQAFVLRSGNGFKISMGTFPDMSRANTVRDSLNQRMAGEVLFTSRLKAQTFRMRKIMTGRFSSLADARREMRALRQLDSRLRGAFIVRN